MKNKRIETPLIFRKATFDRAKVDQKNRTVAVTFSSEQPVEQHFGQEILDHSAGAVDLSFLNSGHAPLLKDHDRWTQIGVVESAKIGSDRRGHAIIRFAKDDISEAEFQNVCDGIRANVSVGYRVKKMELVEKGEAGDVYKVVRWIPKEISTVSIPADASVGVGRHDGQTFNTEIVDRSRSSEVTKMDIQVEIEREKNRAADLLAIGEMHDCMTEARKAIENGTTTEQFQAETLARLRARGVTPVNTTSEIGLSMNEVRQFSFLRAIRALANPTDRSLQEAAGFEMEASKAVADVQRRDPQGLFVPIEVLRHDMKRDMQVGVGSQGGYFTQTQLLAGSFIDKLENAMVCLAMGAMPVRDLVGDVAFPKLTGGATAYWVGEGTDVTESTPTTGQVRLSFKTVGAFTDLTRQFIKQSSIDAESWIREVLARALALELDSAALSGSGSPDTPLGILNTSGIGSVTLNAVNTPNWANIVDMETEVAVDNALVGKLGYVANSTIAGKMKQTQAVSGEARFILESKDGKLNGHPFLMSNQVTAGHILFGNWADLVLGFWAGLDINADTATHSKSGGVRVVALQSADVALQHAESFCDGYKA